MSKKSIVYGTPFGKVFYQDFDNNSGEIYSNPRELGLIDLGITPFGIYGAYSVTRNTKKIDSVIVLDLLTDSCIKEFK